MTKLPAKRSVRLVLAILFLAALGLVSMKVTLLPRQRAFEEQKKRAEHAAEALCKELGPMCRPRYVLVSVGYVPSSPITFYKEVSLDTSTFKLDARSLSAVIEKVSTFCSTQEGFRFGGTWDQRKKWHARSAFAPQQEIVCWVREEVPAEH